MFLFNLFNYQLFFAQYELLFILAFILYIIGFIGTFVSRSNLLTLLMSIELMLLAINLLLIMSAIYSEDISGEIFAVIILTLAAAEASIGLALLIVYYRLNGIITASYISSLKG